MNILEDISNEFCLIDEQTFRSVVQTQGVFFEEISQLDRYQIAKDLLNAEKALKQADILQRYCSLEGKKVLEVGSGLGVNHIVWTKRFGIDGYGIEPSEEGFNSSFDLSKRLINNNKLDSSRIRNACGESLPFLNDSFDIVYSTNVLEHTANPEAVIAEAFRVLRPNGIMQFVYPNFHSYFDGHYALFHPPIIHKSFFPWYVKTIFNRDPTFAKTLRTELNILWTKNVLQTLSSDYCFKLLGLGEDIFYERMSGREFKPWAGLVKIERALSIIKCIGINKAIGRILIKINGVSPIILTVKKQYNLAH